MTDHNQVKIHKTAYVDEGMAPLLQALWDRWVDTEWSCQDNMGKAYIIFPGSFDCSLFSLILQDHNIPHRVKIRRVTYGGGALVEFSPADIEKVTYTIESFTKGHSLWYPTGSKLHQRAKKAVHDYTERHLLNDPSQEVVTSFGSPKISSYSYCLKESEGAISGS